MTSFVDPRTSPTPHLTRIAAQITSEPSELDGLRRLCREARLYDVERWIQEGRPLQLAAGVKVRRWDSPLEIALDRPDHALTRFDAPIAGKADNV